MMDGTAEVGEGGLAEPASLPPVYTAYFYFFKFDADGNHTLRVYEKFNIFARLPGPDVVASELVLNAINPNGGVDPRPYGNEFDHLFRRRKGYFIVALDGAEFQSDDPIVFRCDEATHADTPGQAGRHTFHRLGRHDVDLLDRRISVATYLYSAQSHHRKGDLPRNEWEHYCITIMGQLGLRADVPLYDDSGGTNMGPPPPPPLLETGGGLT